MNHQPPSNLIDLGLVFDAQGLKGHIKVRPHSQDPVALLSCKQVYLQANPNGLRPNQMFTVKSAKMHTSYVIMLLEGIEDRDAALALKGQSLLLPRESFPNLDEDSYYWVDLIGCEVHNEQGIHLGQVDDMTEFGAHPVMKIGQALIPFVPAIVKSVELKTADGKRGMIVVDWQANWSQ